MTSDLLSLSGRVALVTGASSGFGAHFARVVARAGAKVVLAARRVDRLTSLQKEIEDAGGAAVAVQMDVADEASTRAAYDQAEAAFGPIDTIIANAGVSWGGRTADMPMEQFDTLMAANLRGAFLTAREGARRLMAAGSRESGNGRIVFISSITAERPEAGITAYAASKAAVIAMAKSMAIEWVRKGVNVNVICPGYVKTELNDAWFDTAGGDEQVAKFHRRRLMETSDMDAALLLFSSDASRGITGAVLTVDDGQSL